MQKIRTGAVVSLLALCPLPGHGQGSLARNELYPVSAAETAVELTAPDLTLDYPYLDIRRYGGNPADGATNSDLRAMEAAVAVAAVNGGTVYFPEGTWNGCITIKSQNVSVAGAGNSASVIEADGCDGITLDYKSYYGHNVIRDVAIFGVNGSKRAGITAPGSLDDNYETYGISIERVMIRHFNVGIHFRTARLSTITNSRIEDVDRGIELLGKNIGAHIAFNKIIHTAGGGGAGSDYGLYMDSFNYTSGAGEAPPEGVQSLNNLIYGFPTAIKIGLANFVNIIGNDLYGSQYGVDFTTVNLGFNITDSYFDMNGSEVLAGIYGRAVSAASIGKISIQRNGLTATAASRSSAVGIKLNDARNGGQAYVDISDNFTSDFPGGDIVVDNAGETTITGNRCASSAAASSISVPAVLTGTVYIDRNTCTKAIKWDPTEAASGEVVLGINTINGSTKLYGSQQVPTVSSASSIALPLGSDAFQISGTTSITSVAAAGWSGRTVHLKFQGVLTVIDGGNLHLNGNFVTSGDDVITLVCIGADWYEVARSAN